MSRPPSDPLLRTLAAVAPGTRVLDLGGDRGRHAEPLALLGLDVYAVAADAAEAEATRSRLSAPLGPDAERRVAVARPGALGYADAWFEWVVATNALDVEADLADALAELRRVLAPGGWVFLSLPAQALGPGAVPDALTDLAAGAGLALAEAPVEEEEPTGRRVRGIYRRVDERIVR